MLKYYYYYYYGVENVTRKSVVSTNTDERKYYLASITITYNYNDNDNLDYLTTVALQSLSTFKMIFINYQHSTLLLFTIITSNCQSFTFFFMFISTCGVRTPTITRRTFTPSFLNIRVFKMFFF